MTTPMAVPYVSAIVTLAGALLGSVSANAGPPVPSPSRAWTLGPRLGIGLSETRDEVLGPLAYAGPQPVLGFVYTYEDEANRHQAQLELAPAYKVDRFGYRSLFFTQRAEYRYLRSLPSISARGTSWRVGVGAGLELDPALYADASTDFPYWQTVYDLRIVARWQHRLDRDSSVEVDGTLSLFGMGSRPPVKRMDVGEFQVSDLYSEAHTDFRFLSFHNHGFVELRPCLRFSGLGPGSRSLCYGFALRRLSEPKPIVTLDNRLDLTFWF